MIILRELTQTEVQTEAWSVWNAYIDLLAIEDYSDLTPEQRPAHLVFWYMSEVENGGHLQYFENRGTERLVETIQSLATLGAPCHEALLREAGELWLGQERARPQTVQEFCDMALESDMEDYDSRFSNCSPSLDEVLEAHLKDNQSFFIRVN